MSRVVLVSWDREGAPARAQRLRRAGHDVELLAPRGAASLRRLREEPPDAVVADLGRRPSEGRAVALWLRGLKVTRLVPLVLAGGDPGTVARLRQLLPDAMFADWARVRSGVRSALGRPPGDPVVPGAMTPYAGVPLVRKLGVRPGFAVALVGAPEAFEAKLAPLPKGATVSRPARGRADLVVLFTRSRAELERRLPGALRRLAPGGSVWIAWPKQASGAASDLTQPGVRAAGIAAGLVDFKIAALDETWSGLRFACRRGEAAGTAHSPRRPVSS